MAQRCLKGTPIPPSPPFREMLTIEIPSFNFNLTFRSFPPPFPSPLRFLAFSLSSSSTSDW